MGKPIKYRQATFSWAEVFSDSESGKSSATAVAGIACIGIGLLGFMVSLVFLFFAHGSNGGATTEPIYQSTILIGLGSALLGVRRLSLGKSGLGGMSGNEDDIIDEGKTGGTNAIDRNSQKKRNDGEQNSNDGLYAGN